MTTNLRMSDCDVWPNATNDDGYGVGQYKGKVWLMHRAAWDEQVGPIPDGLFVLHRCDNPPCRKIKHLFLGTQSENLADMRNKDRAVNVRGKKNGQTKLTEEQVLEMRALYSGGGHSYQSLATDFGIAKSTVQWIIKRKSWAWL